jgi:hypothetical protein
VETTVLLQTVNLSLFQVSGKRKYRLPDKYASTDAPTDTADYAKRLAKQFYKL